MELITTKINSLEEEIVELRGQLKNFMFSHKKTTRALLKKVQEQTIQISRLERDRQFNDASFRNIYREFNDYRERTDERLRDLEHNTQTRFNNIPNNIPNTDYINTDYNILNNLNNIYLETIQNSNSPLRRNQVNRNIPEDREIPQELICPITLELMEHPVIVSDGNSYEFEAIMEVMETEERRSPLTREILVRGVVIPNNNLRKTIDDFCS